ncbi:MAG: SpoIIE family protein phosphatase [Candidatus Methanomethylophilaceae archaeon]|nr:SpoIIE family protein phosphatase [Candidatus Methanomethylophilaceae archaeon]
MTETAEKKGIAGFLGCLFKKPPSNDVLDEILAQRDSRGDRILEIMIAAVILMNIVWINLEDEMPHMYPIKMDILYASIAIMFICAVACILIGSRWWTKYLLIGSIALNSFIIVGVIDHTMMIMMILPVVSSCIYYRNNLTKAMIVLCALLMLIGLFLYGSSSPIAFGLYYGMTELDRMVSMITTFYIVDLLIYLLICIPCYYATKNGIDDIRKEYDLRREQIGMEKEMSNARGIQQGLLIKDFPCKQYCDISSFMSASKEVGGDFYDCFRIGDDRLAIVMADVSGKGLSAALFMATSMTLIRSNVQAGGDLEKAMEKANRELAASNPMKYFVTVWIGIIDLRHGGLSFVNAGHNPPFIRKDGKYEMLISKPDFVFGRKKRMTYNRHHINFDVGDGIFLYTDGVTEAAGPDGSMFGVDRLKESLSSVGNLSPDYVLSKIKSDVDNFVRDADQSDDMTMMQVDYTHAYDLKPDDGIKVRADREGYALVMERIKQRMTEGGCPPRTITEMETACSEIYANIDMYAYADKEEKGDVLVTTDIVNGAVRITFKDWGIPFNPIEHETPDPIASFKERKRGGLGIMLVKKICDDVSYVREGNCNILKLEKEM